MNNQIARSNSIKNSKDKLIVVTRRDIHVGYQSVQSAHAGIEFQHEFPQIAQKWHNTSNYLVFLTTDDEFHLERIIQKAIRKGIKISVFREPDIGNQITAVALEPSDATKKITSHLPLLGKREEAIS